MLLPVSVVPLANDFTRLSSNDESALELVGFRPSLDRVWNAARMAVNSPIVVPEASSMVWMSVRSCCRAVSSVLLDVDDDVDVDAVRLVALVVEAALVVLDELEPAVVVLVTAWA